MWTVDRLSCVFLKVALQFKFVASLWADWSNFSAVVLGKLMGTATEWVRCGLAHGVLGVAHGLAGGIWGEIFPRFMSWLPAGTKDVSAGTMSC